MQQKRHPGRKCLGVLADVRVVVYEDDRLYQDPIITLDLVFNFVITSQLSVRKLLNTHASVFLA